MTKPTYVALTTHGADWWVVLTGPDKETVRSQAEAIIVGDQVDRAKDITVDTELKNLVVVSKSRAWQSWPTAWRRHIRQEGE